MLGCWVFWVLEDEMSAGKTEGDKLGITRRQTLCVACMYACMHAWQFPPRGDLSFVLEENEGENVLSSVGDEGTSMQE